MTIIANRIDFLSFDSKYFKDYFLDIFLMISAAQTLNLYYEFMFELLKLFVDNALCFCVKFACKHANLHTLCTLKVGAEFTFTYRCRR